MSHKLESYITNRYVEATQRMRGSQRRRKIVVYVESYDDVYFWRSLLQDLETDKFFFEVMLPSRTSLQKGKKIAMLNALSAGLGSNLIVCIDADYDYLLGGHRAESLQMLANPYIFHTYTYSIENYQCYAPALHSVCVMATLNDDHTVFDFESFLQEYSRIVWPLFVWNVWAYRYGRFRMFSMAEFAEIVSLKDVNLFNPNPALNFVRSKVNAKVAKLQKQFPEGKDTLKPFQEELIGMGLTPETTYLYMRGHDVFEKVVSPLVEHVSSVLRRRREKEIGQLAMHPTQLQNELAGYRNSSASPVQMLRKHTFYKTAPLYLQIQQDIKRFLSKTT